MTITPKNWKSFQHYKNRKPAWIKLHKTLLDDFAFHRLPLASQALAPRLWLLASEYQGGEITASVEEIAYRLHVDIDDLQDAISPLIKQGFFIASEPLAECKQDACLEKEEEKQVEIEEEKDSTSLRSDFPSDYREQFWASYPNKKGKRGALKVLEAVRKRGDVPWEKLIVAVRAYAATADPQFTKHPQTWLNKGCWDDEPDTRPKPNSVIGAADRLLDKIKEFEREDDGNLLTDLRDGTGSADVRLLPSR